VTTAAACASGAAISGAECATDRAAATPALLPLGGMAHAAVKAIVPKGACLELGAQPAVVAIGIAGI